MKLGVPKETKEKERRVALTPDICKKVISAGFEICIESGAGENSFYSDEKYKEAGCSVADKNKVYSESDVILKINPPIAEEVSLMKKECVLISFMYAATNPSLVESCVKQGISAFSMDAIPRISRAQKMDALSSQNNLAGYKTVLLAANALGKIFPLMMTAGGTLRPAKVVIMGAGIAGLQAIATAKRLGAIVEVSDIRPETKEEIESLGGKFIEVKADESVKMEGGYVTNVSEEFLKKQKELIYKHIADADVVITTALIPGKKAPLLVSDEMVKSMRPGSVIVDMATEQGGNCECSEMNKTIVKHGVIIIGESNLPSTLPMNASNLYAKNISEFLLHLATKDGFKWEMEEEITKGSLIVHKGQITHPSTK